MKARTGQTTEERGLEVLSHVPVHGYINDIDIGPKAKFCVLAVGQEPRLGRWNRIGKAKNRLGIVKLDFEEASPDDSDAGDDVQEEAAGEDYNEPAGVESFSDEN